MRTTNCFANGADGESTLSGISVDITDLHDADQRRMASIGRLAGGIAHELNNALTVIMGSLDLLEAGEDLLAPMREATEQAASVTKSIRALADAANVRLETSIEDSHDVIYVDREALGVAILELVRNALESLEKGGRITFHVRPEASGRGEVEIAVEDDGRGMPEEIRAHAEEPFFTTHAFGANRGLGLSAAYGFTVQSGGRLEIASEPGRGTRVGIWLPVDDQTIVESKGEVDASLPVSVLIVEDEPRVRSVVVRTATALGYRVRSVDSAEAALAAIRAETLEVVFTDVVLSAGIDGVMLARQIHQSHPRISIVIASGYPENQLGMERLQIPHAFLAKPFTRAQIDRALSEAAELARSARDRPANRDPA